MRFDSVEWDVSSEKKQLVIYRKDLSLHLLIHTSKVCKTATVRLVAGYESILTFPPLLTGALCHMRYAGWSDLQPSH